MDLKDIIDFEVADKFIRSKYNELDLLLQEKRKFEKELEDAEYLFNYMNKDDATIRIESSFGRAGNIPGNLKEKIRKLILSEKDKTLSEIKEKIKKVQTKILDMFKE